MLLWIDKIHNFLRINGYPWIPKTPSTSMHIHGHPWMSADMLGFPLEASAYSEGILASLRDHLETTCCRYETTLKPLCCQVGLTLVSLWVQLVLVSVWRQFGISVKSFLLRFCNPIDISFVSHWNHSGVMLDQFRVGVKAIWNRFAEFGDSLESAPSPRWSHFAVVMGIANSGFDDTVDRLY